MAHYEKRLTQKVHRNTCTGRDILCKAECLPPNHVPQGSIYQLIDKSLMGEGRTSKRK